MGGGAETREHGGIPWRRRAREARRVLAEAYGAASTHQISLMAAGVAFYGFLAVFPTLIAAVMIFGLATSPDEAERHIAAQAEILPESVLPLVETAAQNAAAQSPGALSLGVALALAVALWSASAGAAGLMSAATVAYGEAETRSFVRARATALAITAGAIVAAPVALGLVAALPVAFRVLGVGGEVWAWAIQILRWLALAAGVFFALSLIYRVAPDRPAPGAREVAPGAAVATGLWLAASALFSAYMASVGETSYGQTYGPFAGVAIFMLWLFLSAYVVLFGAEINRASEGEGAAR